MFADCLSAAPLARIFASRRYCFRPSKASRADTVVVDRSGCHDRSAPHGRGHAQLAGFRNLVAYPNRDFRNTEVTPYVQDDWKLSSKLTLNLGFSSERSFQYFQYRQLRSSEQYPVPRGRRSEPPSRSNHQRSRQAEADSVRAQTDLLRTAQNARGDAAPFALPNLSQAESRAWYNEER
jgi:hypothetical protein